MSVPVRIVYPMPGPEFPRHAEHMRGAGRRGRKLAPGQWSLAHERCIGCGTQERKHAARGYCYRCCYGHPHREARP